MMISLQEQRDTQHHDWGHIQVDRWQAIIDYAHPRILDVGCANGVYVDRLQHAGYDAYGVDLLTYNAWHTLTGGISMANALQLPFANETFETIISFETLEHVPTPLQALQEYHRVCRKNIIISVPNCETPPALQQSGLTYHHWVDRSHINFFNMSHLQTLVERSGFRIRHHALINKILPALPLLWGFGIPVRPARKLAQIIQKFTPRDYHMTLLIVAEKD